MTMLDTFMVTAASAREAPDPSRVPFFCCDDVPPDVSDAMYVGPTEAFGVCMEPYRGWSASFDASGRQVSTRFHNGFPPDTMARVAADMAGGKLIVPECNGPLGVLLTNSLTACNARLYRSKKRDSPGYWNSDRGAELLSQLADGIRTGEATVCSQVLNELKSVEWYQGRLENVTERLMATALAWHGLLYLRSEA